jgi:TRAP-type C4-dicarboxylate transport system permease small subunit
MMRWLLRLHDGVTIVAFWGATVSVAYLTLATAWEVFGRYALGAPSDWAPDTAAVSFALITFLAAPMLTWKSGHATMTFIVEKTNPAVSRWMTRLTLLIGIGVCGLCTYYGGVEVSRQFSRGVTMIAVTPIPKWIVTAVIVYSFGSITLYFLRHLVSSFRRNDPQEDGGAEWSGTSP